MRSMQYIQKGGASMKEFWITVYKISEPKVKKLLDPHKTRTIHCTILPEKTLIFGTATDKEIDAIIDDIIKLGKDYGVTRRDMS